MQILRSLSTVRVCAYSGVSRAGVENIFAYAWPEHCRKYLEALEYEKRFLRTHKVSHNAFPCGWHGAPSHICLHLAKDQKPDVSPANCTCVLLRLDKQHKHQRKCPMLPNAPHSDIHSSVLFSNIPALRKRRMCL